MRVEGYRSCWERMRMLASIVIQPHVKKKITPKRLLPFPWDFSPSSDKKEDMARFKGLSKLVGS